VQEKDQGRRVKIRLPNGGEMSLSADCDYEIVYCIRGLHRYDRRTRMGFLGTGIGGELLFDARGPDRSTGGQYAGTQAMRPEWIKSIKRVPRIYAKRFVEKRA
jgi:hypothetical protein